MKTKIFLCCQHSGGFALERQMLIEEKEHLEGLVARIVKITGKVKLQYFYDALGTNKKYKNLKYSTLKKGLTKKDISEIVHGSVAIRQKSGKKLNKKTGK